MEEHQIFPGYEGDRKNGRMRSFVRFKRTGEIEDVIRLETCAYKLDELPRNYQFKVFDRFLNLFDVIYKVTSVPTLVE